MRSECPVPGVEHQAPDTRGWVYEQFADTILIDVTLSVGIDEAGVAVPRPLALCDPGVLDEPGWLDDPGRSAEEVLSPLLEPCPGALVPVIWTLWFTCWLRLTPELPADNT